MLKLFAVVLGGRAQGCNIELHDVVFIAGNSLEESYPRLVNKWFGVTKRLHIDSTIELSRVDGHEIILCNEKPDNRGKRLYFVNFGGYREGHFGEIHEARFYVANTKSAALARAKQELGLGLSEPHCDDNVDIDDIFAVDEVDQCYIQLLPSDVQEQIQVDSRYRRLDVPEIVAQAEAIK